MKFNPKLISVESGTIQLMVKTINGREFVKLYVQVLDAYHYQRELIVQEIPDGNGFKWECHAYLHPYFRFYKEISQDVAHRFIARFMEVVEKHPNTTLFSSSFPRHSGFVGLHNRLLAGATLSVDLI